MNTAHRAKTQKPRNVNFLRVKAHIQRTGAERPATCDLIRGNKAVDLFPRIKSQAAGRSAVCVFLP